MWLRADQASWRGDQWSGTRTRLRLGPAEELAEVDRGEMHPSGRAVRGASRSTSSQPGSASGPTATPRAPATASTASVGEVLDTGDGGRPFRARSRRNGRRAAEDIPADERRGIRDPGLSLKRGDEPPGTAGRLGIVIGQVIEPGARRRTCRGAGVGPGWVAAGCPLPPPPRLGRDAASASRAASGDAVAGRFRAAPAAAFAAPSVANGPVIRASPSSSRSDSSVTNHRPPPSDSA